MELVSSTTEPLPAHMIPQRPRWVTISRIDDVYTFARIETDRVRWVHLRSDKKIKVLNGELLVSQ